MSGYNFQKILCFLSEDLFYLYKEFNLKYGSEGDEVCGI